jgi:hypothetical protein
LNVISPLFRGKWENPTGLVWFSVDGRRNRSGKIGLLNGLASLGTWALAPGARMAAFGNCV